MGEKASGESGGQPRNWLPKGWTWETRAWIGLILLLVVGVMLWMAARVLLLFFAAILLALFLSGLADWLSGSTRLSRNWALAVVVFVLAAGLTGTVLLLAPAIGEQFTQLTTEIPKAAAALEQQLRRSTWGQQILNSSPQLSSFASEAPKMLGKATGVTFGFLANVVILVFVGLYLAIDPGIYRGAILRLFPKERRPRLDEVFSVLAATLQRWTVGRLILMSSNAVITAAGLWLMGMRLPAALGLLSGLLNFIPNLGPIIAAVPAVLLALVQGPWMALYVGLFYLVYQAFDGYVLTPVVERRTVASPPALTIMSQVLMGVLFGAAGVLVAVPLVAAGVVMVKMLYLEDVLGEQVEMPPGTEEALQGPEEEAIPNKQTGVGK